MRLRGCRLSWEDVAAVAHAVARVQVELGGWGGSWVS